MAIKDNLDSFDYGSKARGELSEAVAHRCSDLKYEFENDQLVSHI